MILRKRKWNEFLKCDNCGKISPEVFPDGRLTVCCSTYDFSNKKFVFYNTLDKDGRVVYSIGKAYTVQLQFPIRITFKWRPFK